MLKKSRQADQNGHPTRPQPMATPQAYVYHPPAPSCQDSSFTGGYVARRWTTENEAWDKARPWAKRLSWQTQGERVK